MASRQSLLHPLMTAIFLLSGCVHAPSTEPRGELIERIAPEGLGSASTAGEPPARAPRSSTDGAVGRTGIRGEEPPDHPGMLAATGDPADAVAGSPVAGVPRLTLEEAKAQAYRLNPQLRQADAAVETAAGNEEIAYSGFLPTLQGNYSYQAFSSDVGFTGTRGRFPVLPVRGFGPGTQDFHVAELQLRWVVYQFGRQVAKHDQSVLRGEIARLQADRARQSVDFDVSQAYFRALEARSSLVITEQALTSAEAVLRDARNQLRRGVLTAEDVLRAEVQVAEVRQLLTRARSAVRVTVAGLNRAIGLDVSAPTEVADRREEPPVSLTLEEALGLALVNRREIAVVRNGIADADLDVKIARADYLPTLSIQAAVSDVTGTGVQNSNVLGGGAFATLDVYTGGKRRGQLRAARARVWRAAAQAKQVVDGVTYEVHYAHTAVDDARERVAQARTTVAQARENLRLVGNRYKTGDAQPTDVIEAQTTQTRSEQGFNTALFEYQTAVAQLEFAVGAPVTAPAAAPEELAVPPPTTTPSPFARPETQTPSRRARPSPIEIPSLLPPLFPTLTPSPPIQPTTPGPPSGGAPPSGTPGLALPPYIAQPPGRLP